MVPIQHVLLANIRRIPKKFIREVLLAAAALIIVGLIVSLISPYTPNRQYAFYTTDSSESSTYYRAMVVSQSALEVSVRLQDGPSKGLTIQIPVANQNKVENVKVGSSVLVTNSPSTNALVLFDLYRIPLLIMVITLFVIIILLVGRRRGAMSLAGLGASIVVIGWVIVPLVVAGYNSLLVSVSGAFLIAIVSILIAHGINRRSLISLLCILVVLMFVAIGSLIAVSLLGLTGLIDETGYLIEASHPNIDLSGILIGGIVIAALGALDDIVTTQVATVSELKKANPSLSVGQLYTRALAVGSEHIAALVNTLALVYVGAALPLIVTYAISTPELVQLFNSEFVATEIVRTVIVSIGLVLSVPISTYIASLLLHKYFKESATV
jgi:uncharacterized membrane protein